MGQFFILHSRVCLLTHWTVFLKAICPWIITKLEFSCVRNIIPRSRKRLWNGYPVLNQELQNHDPAHTCIGNVWEYPPGVQAAHNNHWGLKRSIGQPHLGDYIKGSGIAHPTQLHKTFTHKKRVEKERQQKKAKYTNIKQQKSHSCTKLSDNLYSVSSAKEAQS